MRDLAIRSHRGLYQVHFGDAFEGLEGGLNAREHLIIDERVAQLYAAPLSKALQGSSVLRIEATEAHKSLERFSAYATHLIEQGVRRDHVLIAVGGGIIQDITAFLAGTLLRGLSWKFFPTTLLAQADSCIGSKSSVNIGSYKNLLGTYTPPAGICIATGVLSTLAESDMRSGIGEMIKAHIISGWKDTRKIAAEYPLITEDKNVLERTIHRSLEIKKEKIEQDEFDQGERLVMNYGHTFGHAIESATDYAIPHGLAVTLGMDIANYVSCRLGLIQQTVYDELHVFLSTNYKGFDHVPIHEEKFFSALSKDKKGTTRDLSVILLRGPGQVFRVKYPRGGRVQELCRDYLSMLEGRRREPCLSR